jgi:hypothetical protein
VILPDDAGLRASPVRRRRVRSIRSRKRSFPSRIPACGAARMSCTRCGDKGTKRPRQACPWTRHRYPESGRYRRTAAGRPAARWHTRSPLRAGGDAASETTGAFPGPTEAGLTVLLAGEYGLAGIARWFPCAGRPGGQQRGFPGIVDPPVHCQQVAARGGASLPLEGYRARAISPSLCGVGYRVAGGGYWPLSTLLFAICCRPTDAPAGQLLVRSQPNSCPPAIPSHDLHGRRRNNNS